jgi:hypothetical protein
MISAVWSARVIGTWARVEHGFFDVAVWPCQSMAGPVNFIRVEGLSKVEVASTVV